jgi:hypothetical protein
MINNSSNFTTCFVVSPEPERPCYNAISSLLELNPPAQNVFFLFNPYNKKKHSHLLSLEEVLFSDIVKTSKKQTTANCWNRCIQFSQSRYVIILSEDMVFTDTEIFKKVQSIHSDGFGMVYLNESGCFSLDKSIIPKVGWFDEDLDGQHNEIDYQMRLTNEGVESYRFSDEIIRSFKKPPDDGGVDYNCDFSFSDKWDLSSNTRMKMVDFYPEYTRQYKNKNYSY